MRTVALTFLVICSAFLASSQDKQVEEFAEQMFGYVKADNFKKFRKYVVAEKDIIALIKASDMSEEKKKKELEKFKKMKKSGEWKKYYEKIGTGFHSIRQSAIDSGVVWKDAEYKGCEYEIKVRDGISKTDIYICFVHAGKQFAFKLDDTLLSKRGWILADDPKWRANFEFEKFIF